MGPPPPQILGDRPPSSPRSPPVTGVVKALAAMQLRRAGSVSRHQPRVQATTSEGLAQGPFVAACEFDSAPKAPNTTTEHHASNIAYPIEALKK